MNRRELFGVGAAVGIAAFARDAGADDKKPASSPRTAMLDAIEACVAKGELCRAHCQTQLANGAKEFGHCNAAVTDMLEVCRATASLVARQSLSAKRMVDVCAAVCKECSAACLEHKAHFAHGMHLECKACMEACDASVKAAAAYT